MMLVTGARWSGFVVRWLSSQQRMELYCSTSSCSRPVYMEFELGLDRYKLEFEWKSWVQSMEVAQLLLLPWPCIHGGRDRIGSAVIKFQPSQLGYHLLVTEQTQLTREAIRWEFAVIQWNFLIQSGVSRAVRKGGEISSFHSLLYLGKLQYKLGAADICTR